MKTIVLIPDSFKGTMSSAQVCQIVAGPLRDILGAGVVSVPVADGGEGSVDAFLSAVPGKKVPLTVKGPMGAPVSAFYGMLDDGTAVVEMAAAAGLPLMEGHLDVLGASTYGVGQLAAHALAAGAKKLLVALGGSATNDGACGMAAALGARFLDQAGRAFVPTGGTLEQVQRVDLSHLIPALRTVPVVAMCDIDNPLCGPAGAAAVFGPQKGADAAAVARLDDGLRHLAAVFERDLGARVLDLPGGGAAGGMGAGLAAMLGARLCPGIDAVLDAVHFEELLGQADLVITGEGRLDGQSVRGKVVAGVARRAKAARVPVVALCGDVEGPLDAVYAAGVSAVFSTNRVARDFSVQRAFCRQNLAAVAQDLARLLAATGWG